jgi:hypothetical protein
MSDNIYIGRGWVNNELPNTIRIQIRIDELEDIQTNIDGEITLVVGKRKDPDPRTGSTHYVKIDTNHKRKPIEDFSDEDEDIRM